MNNTLPLKNQENQRLSRKFLGNLFPQNGIEKKELHAYIKGQTHFYFGRDEQGFPRRFEVRQKYFYTNN